MTTQNQPTQNYTMGYSEEFLQLLERRNAGNSAAYLLPLLEPGTKLLDLGCGPGTITMGLAEAVSPGEVHGIDMEESQIALAAGRGGSQQPYQRNFPRGQCPFPALRGRNL